MKRISSSPQNQYNLIRINIKVHIYKYAHPYSIYIQMYWVSELMIIKIYSKIQEKKEVINWKTISTQVW